MKKVSLLEAQFHTQLTVAYNADPANYDIDDEILLFRHRHPRTGITRNTFIKWWNKWGEINGEKNLKRVLAAY